MEGLIAYESDIKTEVKREGSKVVLRVTHDDAVLVQMTMTKEGARRLARECLDEAHSIN
jgi:hypothetical protein